MPANPLTEMLQPYVQRLQQGAAAGDKNAASVIDLYKLHCSCPSDPCAPALCEAAFTEWKRGQEETALTEPKP
jgi:hypothetical protein